MKHDIIFKITEKMTEYFCGDPRRIQHFIKVNFFAKHIAHGEGIDENTFFIIDAASLVHDIGIKLSEQKYGNANGKNQEKEGPAEAQKLLFDCGADSKSIERICFLVGHHHTYSKNIQIDLQILVEADFIVNLYEESSDIKTITAVKNNIFKTASGTKLLCDMFGLNR